MSAKDAPIALRSHQTMIGVIDKWRTRREWMREYADACVTTDRWAAQLQAAERWEWHFGPKKDGIPQWQMKT